MRRHWHSWPSTSVDADFHLATLSKAESAKDAWETLEAVYQAKSTARRLQMKRELNNLRKEPSEALTKYVSRATDLRDQLIAAGHTIEDSEVVMSVQLSRSCSRENPPHSSDSGLRSAATTQTFCPWQWQILPATSGRTHGGPWTA